MLFYSILLYSIISYPFLSYYSAYHIIGARFLFLRPSAWGQG